MNARIEGMTQVVIESRAGTIVAVYGASEVEVVLVDWDEVEADPFLAQNYPVDAFDKMPPDTRALVLKR